MKQYEKEKELIISCLKESYNLFSQQGMSIENKKEFDLVTSFDKNVEQYITNIINKEFPEDAILGEEFCPNTSILNRTWTIDPIDGTNNMAHNSMVYGLQVALIENDEIVFGVIYLPHLNEIYYGIKGFGSFLNDKKIETNRTVNANNIMVSLGDFSHNSKEISEMQLNIVKFLKDKVARIRMFGAACYDYTFAAIGRTDGVIMLSRNLWDIAPGIIICKEAGLNVTDIKNRPYKIGELGVVVSANKDLHNILIDACQ